MKKILLALLSLTLLVGCGKAKESIQEQTNNSAASMDSFDNSYYKVIDFGASELRESFYQDFNMTSDFQTIGRGLEIISSDHYSTSNYYMSEGQYFGYDQKNQLLKRSEDVNEYPYSLQPAKGSAIEGVKDAIMVSNIYEQDFYVKDGNKYTLKGLSVAIVLDPKKSDNSDLDVAMSESALNDYGKTCIDTFYKYYSEAEEFDELDNIPIVIAVYTATNTEVSTVDGNYILKSYCEKSVGEIKKVNHENVIYGSARSEELDPTTHSDFTTVKTALKEAATESAGLVGEAKYVDDKIQSMVITANLNVKTYSELLYLTSLLADNIDTKFTYDFSIKVLVKSQDKLEAVIVKEAGQKAKSYDLY